MLALLLVLRPPRPPQLGAPLPEGSVAQLLAAPVLRCHCCSSPEVSGSRSIAPRRRPRGDTVAQRKKEGARVGV